MQNIFEVLLEKIGTRPVLVDIGASAGPPLLWQQIASHSIYVGFDPDSRDFQTSEESGYYKTYLVNKAVSCGDEDEIEFYLTTSPYCSSTLHPDSKALSDFLFADRFEIIRRGKVRADNLNSILQALSLDRIDWLKVDSQGTDLRIFNSIADNLRNQVLAIDVEPGLIDAYENEDLFVDVHRALTRAGFWLSNLTAQGAVRLKRKTAEALSLSEADIYRNVRLTPAWCEARYFRTLQFLTDRRFDPSGFVLSWIFAMMDGQYGFALDVALHCEQSFDNEWRILAGTMKQESLDKIRQLAPRSALASAKALIKKGIGR